MPDCMLTPPTNESVITYTQLSGVQGVDTQSHVIDDVMSLGLSHDESFGVDDLDLNLNEPVNLNVSQIETQSEPPMSEEPDVGRTQAPIVAKVNTREPIMAKVPTVEKVRTQELTLEDVVLEDYVSSGEDAEPCNGQFDESAPSDGQLFYEDEGIDIAYEMEYDIQSSKDVGTDDDDDDEDLIVDEENEIVEPDVDVHLFDISIDLPFDNIGVTNLVPNDIVEGEDEDVINADGFDSDPDNDDETINYKRRRLAELSREMKGFLFNGMTPPSHASIDASNAAMYSAFVEDIEVVCSFMLCDLDFEPLSLSLSSLPSCDLVSLTNMLILLHYLESFKSELAEVFVFKS
ncbi:hypothetical protein Tco_0874509 [Tanacetum coccineum]|uniref:Uncharacterized protein n=1 Tax=Tanacetum coccineum TaxID=301880 RepID=A0ABQ5BMK7_9ASTR